jgi:hypothetical protein
MITTTHPNNRYSIQTVEQKYTLDKNTGLPLVILTQPNVEFKIFPNPGEIVLAGNFRVGYTDPNLKPPVGPRNMMHAGVGVGDNAPHGSINYLEEFCKSQYNFQDNDGIVNYSFNMQVYRINIKEVYSTTSNFPIYLIVTAELSGFIFDTIDPLVPSLSIDLDFDLMQ